MALRRGSSLTHPTAEQQRQLQARGYEYVGIYNSENVQYTPANGVQTNLAIEFYAEDDTLRKLNLNQQQISVDKPQRLRQGNWIFRDTKTRVYTCVSPDQWVNKSRQMSK